MISDRALAQTVLSDLFDLSGRLDRSIATVMEAAPSPEFVAYRLAIGTVMGELWDQVLKPILREHPELAPEGLNGMSSG